VPPIAITSAERIDRARYLEQSVANFGGVRSGPVPEIPSAKPPIDSLLISDEGRIWVKVHVASERYEPTPMFNRTGRAIPVVPWREPAEYDVFEATGIYLGRVTSPSGLRIFCIRGNTVWGVVTDKDGVHTVKRYRVGWSRELQVNS
jgi:hypothetical protein